MTQRDEPLGVIFIQITTPSMHKAPNQIPRDVLQEWYCVISALRGPDCDLCWERTRFHWSLSLKDSVTSPVALLTCPAETTYGGQKTLAHSFRGFSHGWEGRVEHLVMVV